MADEKTTGAHPPSGGPSTVWGILYQMIWCLLRALRTEISDVQRDASGRIAQAVLRLEPRTGGDVEVLDQATRRVIQLKTRSRGRTWSLRDLIVDVLPDLYKAVDLDADDTAYDFVTDAEMGRWQEAYAFFRSLRDRDPGDDPLQKLDDQTDLKFTRHAGRGRRKVTGEAEPTPFWTAGRYTQRALFEHVAGYLRRTSAVPRDEPFELTRRKLWHLLGRLNFVGGHTFQRIQTEVDSLLLALVDHPEEVREKRDALITWLAHRAAEGDAAVVTDDLLRQHNLDVTSLTDWAALRARARQILQRDLELRQYREAYDVRADAAASLWHSWDDPAIPLLGLSGDSGDGKSWRLYALGLSAAQDEGVAVLVDATGNADDDLQRGADIFWQDIKGNGGSQPLARIAALRKRLLHKGAEQWLTVLIDGVQSPEEALRLAHQPLREWGVRVAITGPPDVVAVFQRAGGTRATVVSVGPFSPGERDDYLERRLGDRWVNIRSDVRDTLRRPLLAAIYCDEVAEPDGWRSTDEYDLFDRMWERLSTGPHAPGPYDAVRLASLALTVLTGVRYPWPAAAVQQAGIDESVLGRVTRTGWLRRAPQERFEVPHDRLLNYAVARGLFYAEQTGEYSLDQLVQTVRRLLSDHETFGGRRLAYVPMDLLHLLLAAGPEEEVVFGRMLQELDNLHHDVRRTLYTELLPTLGKRVVGCLFTRLEAATGPDASLRQRLIIDGIITFAADDVCGHALRLLSDDSSDLQRAAIRILAERPSRAALDRLWIVHCRMQDEPERYGLDSRSFFLYEESMAALRACVAADPSWIERTLHAEQAGGRHVHDLAYLVAGLPDGREIWRRCKTVFLAKVPASKFRSIVVNIGRYRDHEELNRLLSLIEISEDSVGPAALRALVRIDPDLAVEHLVRLPAHEMYMTRNWYLPHLLEVRREEVNRRLLAHMRASDDAWDVADVYSEAADEFDPEALDFLLDELETLLQRVAENPPPENRRPLWRPLDLLARVNRLDLLECFRRRKRTELERRLGDFLIAMGPQRGAWREGLEREPGMAVLAKIGGSEYVRVANDYLAKGDRFGRREAIAFAHRSADAETVRLLKTITEQEELWDGFPVEQLKATDALALK